PRQINEEARAVPEVPRRRLTQHPVAVGSPQSVPPALQSPLPTPAVVASQHQQPTVDARHLPPASIAPPPTGAPPGGQARTLEVMEEHGNESIIDHVFGGGIGVITLVL